MKASDKLHILIHSLRKNEKGYIKKYSSIHGGGENDYLKLFDAIDQQPQYDEQKIKRQFADTALGRRLPVAKNYLYTLILKSMRAYQAEASVEHKIKGHLLDVEFLYDKGLFGACAEVLAKAEAMATSYEKEVALLEILHWKKKLSQKQIYSQDHYGYFTDLCQQEKALLKRVDTINEYHRLSNEITPQERRGVSRSPREAVDMERLLQHPFMKDDQRPKSYREELHYYYVLRRCCYAKGDFEGSYHASVRFIELIEERPHLIEEEPIVYFEGLKYLLPASLQLRKHKEHVDLLKKLRAFYEQLPSNKALSGIKRETLDFPIFTVLYQHLLGWYLTTGNFAKGMTLLDPIESGLKRFQRKDYARRYIGELLGRQDMFYFFMASVCIGAQALDRALTYLNRILLESRHTIREDILSYARFLSLVVHFTMNDDDVLASQIQATQRYLTKINRLNEFEKILLNFFKQTLRGTGARSLCALARQTHKQLLAIASDPFESKAFDYFDFLSWLESLESDLRYADVVQRKARKAIGAIAEI